MSKIVNLNFEIINKKKPFKNNFYYVALLDVYPKIETHICKSSLFNILFSNILYLFLLSFGFLEIKV